MPELPEIEIVKRSLFKKVNKAKISKIEIYNKNLRYKIAKSFSKDLKGEKILNITRRSKYLIFHLKKKLLLAHFGMSGKLFLFKKKNSKIFKTSFYYDLNILPKHNHICFFLDNGFKLIYNDVRKFGFFKLYDHTKPNKIVFLEKLGIEPLSKKFDAKYFKNFTKNKKKNLKNLLMDQTFISGLGNIYVNEALFMSKINPLKICNTLIVEEIERLILNIKKVLKNSISKGGSSIRDFTNSQGKNGSFQQFFYVYGKESKNCSRISCKGKIRKILISGRSSFYCDKCQI